MAKLRPQALLLLAMVPAGAMAHTQETTAAVGKPLRQRTQRRRMPKPPSSPRPPTAPATRAEAPLQVSLNTPSPAAGDETLEPPPERKLELSFGSALLFRNQSVYDPGGLLRERVLPVTAVTVIGEWAFHPRVSGVVNLTWPVEPESRFTGGEIQRFYLAPSLKAGVNVTPLYFEVLNQTTLDLQLAALAGSTMGQPEGDEFFPAIVWRLHLADDNGFTLYAGSAFFFRLDTISLIYGVGHRF